MPGNGGAVLIHRLVQPVRGFLVIPSGSEFAGHVTGANQRRGQHVAVIGGPQQIEPGLQPVGRIAWPPVEQHGEAILRLGVILIGRAPQPGQRRAGIGGDADAQAIGLAEGALARRVAAVGRAAIQGERLVRVTCDPGSGPIQVAQTHLRRPEALGRRLVVPGGGLRRIRLAEDA